jgi:ribosomal protein S18 acetylase RimI-like enzyme
MTMGRIAIAPATPADHGWIVETARALLGSERQVHSRRQFEITDGHVLVATLNDQRAGFVTWDHDGAAIEILALACTTQRAGVGTALVDAVAAAAGGGPLRVVTTDTNVGAQAFYVRNGFTLVARLVGAVDECRRRYKPELPLDMHDELVYERPHATSSTASHGAVDTADGVTPVNPTTSRWRWD